MRLLALVAVIALAGCATSRTTYMPDGRQGHAIDCSGSLVPWSACQKKAGDICKARGYDIISANGEQGSTFVATNNLATGGTTSSKSMLIACK
jgi:hypothetical protein